jgi:hypothetical protein
MPTRTAIDAGPTWGDLFRCLELLVTSHSAAAALHEVIRTGLSYPQDDPVVNFASLAPFGDLTRDEALQAGYRSSHLQAATRLRLSSYRIYLYL